MGKKKDEFEEGEGPRKKWLGGFVKRWKKTDSEDLLEEAGAAKVKSASPSGSYNPQVKRRRKRSGGVAGPKTVGPRAVELTPQVTKPLKATLKTVELGEKGKKIKPQVIEEILEDLETMLIEGDVAQPVVQRILRDVYRQLEDQRISRGADVGEVIIEAFRSALVSVLKRNQKLPLLDGKKFRHFDDWILAAPRPLILMFVGVNGTGKTTTIAKLAFRIQKKLKLTCVIANCDTFRAGASEQMQIHADRVGVKLIQGIKGADPASVARDAVEHAKARKKDVVLIDTAGRMQTNKNLMEEMKKIRRVSRPHQVIFLGDALTGNDSIEQATQFNDAFEHGLDGIILSKIDTDARGGAALSIAYSVGKPLLYVGTGQDYRDLKRFSPKWIIDQIFADD